LESNRTNDYLFYWLPYSYKIYKLLAEMNKQAITIAKYNAGDKFKKKLNLNKNITVAIQECANQTSTILSGVRYLQA